MKNLITVCALAASLTLAACGEDNTNGPVDEPIDPPIQEESMPERPALGAPGAESGQESCFGSSGRPEAFPQALHRQWGGGAHPTLSASCGPK